MECQLCDLPAGWTLFWVSLGPALTLLGSVLLLAVAYRVLKAEGVDWRVIRAVLARPFKRTQTGDVGTVVELETAPGVGVAPGGRATLSVTRDDAQSALESAKRLKEIGTTDFELAVIEAVNDLLSMTQERDERLELLEVALAASKAQAKKSAEREKELRRRMGEERDASLRRDAETNRRVSDLASRGMWPTVSAGLLIPLGIAVGLIVDGCRVFC